MTFLELVQMVARESGTVPGTQPPTLGGELPARLDKMKHWVNLAWQMIQNHKLGWNWMRGEFVAETAPGVAKYSGVSLGISRFRKFVTISGSMRIHDPENGIDDESFLIGLDYWRYRRIYGIREQSLARPTYFSVSEADGSLCLGPVPDKYYVLNGEYHKSPQSLVNDDDIPELPEHFHPIIAWQALMLLAGHDEGAFAVGNAAANYRQYLANLERDQLPALKMARTFF